MLRKYGQKNLKIELTMPVLTEHKKICGNLINIQYEVENKNLKKNYISERYLVRNIKCISQHNSKTDKIQYSFIHYIMICVIIFHVLICRSATRGKKKKKKVLVSIANNRGPRKKI